MRRSKQMWTAYWCFAALALQAGFNPAMAQTKDQRDTTQTSSSSGQQTSQQSPSAPTQTPTRGSRDNGIKIDPVKATKTIIDIFGKKKKPKETPQAQPAPTPTPVPEIATPEPEATTSYPQPDAAKQQPRTVPAAPPQARNVPQAATQTKLVPNPTAKNLVQQTPVEDLPKTAKAAAPPPEATASAPEPAAANVIEEDGSGPTWPLVIALLLIATLIQAAVRWYFFPKADIDLEILEGESRLGKTASPFATLPEASFDLEFEWGSPSTPQFTLAPVGN